MPSDEDQSDFRAGSRLWSLDDDGGYVKSISPRVSSKATTSSLLGGLQGPNSAVESYSLMLMDMDDGNHVGGLYMIIPGTALPSDSQDSYGSQLYNCPSTKTWCGLLEASTQTFDCWRLGTKTLTSANG